MREATEQMDRDFERYLAAYEGDIIQEGILQRGRNRVQALKRAVHGAVPETLAAL